MTEVNHPQKGDSFLQGKDSLVRKVMVMTFMQKPTRTTCRSRGVARGRRWWIGLLAVCLLAIGAYTFLIRVGEA